MGFSILAIFSTLFWVSTIFGTPNSYRLIALGDLHGDLYHTLLALYYSGVMDVKGNWVGGSTTLVQVGDVINKGPHGRPIYKLLRELRKQAVEVNGSVVMLLGNHEINAIRNASSYNTTEEEIILYGGLDARIHSFEKGAGDIGDFLRTLPAFHEHHGTLLCHAGLLPHLAKRYGTNVTQLNNLVWDLIEQGNWSHPLFGPYGPFNTKALVREAKEQQCDTIEDALRMFNVQRLVVGHVPQRKPAKISFYCNNKLMAIDTAMSRFMWNKNASKGRGVVRTLEVLTDAVTGKVKMSQLSIPIPEDFQWDMKDDDDSMESAVSSYGPLSDKFWDLQIKYIKAENQSAYDRGNSTPPTFEIIQRKNEEDEEEL